MQEHTLGVGEELVFEGGTRLTILAVEAGEALLAITAPNPATRPPRLAGPPTCREAASYSSGRRTRRGRDEAPDRPLHP
jgi:hypothetical protein